MKKCLCLGLMALLICVSAATAMAQGSAPLLCLSGPSPVQPGTTYTLTLTYLGTDPVSVTYQTEGVVLSGEPTYIDEPAAYTFSAAVGETDTAPVCIASVQFEDGTVLRSQWNVELVPAEPGTDVPEPSNSPCGSPSPQPTDSTEPEPASSCSASQTQPAASSNPPSQQPSVSTSNPAPTAVRDNVPKTGDASADPAVLAVLGAVSLSLTAAAIRKLREAR